MATKIARSAKTGRLISKSEAEANPSTTVVETVKRSNPQTAFKLPKTLAECADMAYALREERYAVQKAAKEIADREALLREHIIQNLPKSNASGISGKIANARVETDTVPTIEDKDKFLAHVKKTGEFDLITAGMNASAVRARWESKKKVPGVGEAQVVKLSLTKVK